MDTRQARAIATAALFSLAVVAVVVILRLLVPELLGVIETAITVAAGVAAGLRKLKPQS